MEPYRLGDMEQKFASLIWSNAPIPSGELVRLCEREFQWKKSTTYTMLRRLCERGLFQNSGGTVTALLSQEDFHAQQGIAFLQDTFGGSLPQFFAAFTRRRKLSSDEIREIQQLIDAHREEE